tara:strand:+ start:333 stop:911 length:579 start_codon:yes stop_codon:yes gene_type:complete
MKRFTEYIREALDTVHPHKQVSNEVDDFDIVRDLEDRPIGVSGRTIRHAFEDPHSGHTVHVTHRIDHDIDDYDPKTLAQSIKNPKATRISVSFSRSPGEGSTEHTYARVKGGKGTLGIFSTVGHITKNMIQKHGKGETTVNMDASNSRVPSYVRMGERLSGGVAPEVTPYSDRHRMYGHSKISIKVPKGKNQ